MIEIFLEAPLELKIIILAGLSLVIYEFLKLARKEDNNAKKGHR